MIKTAATDNSGLFSHTNAIANILVYQVMKTYRHTSYHCTSKHTDAKTDY